MAASLFDAVLASSVSVGLCLSCAALAGSGRVNFSGAVVEPTCRTQVVERMAAMLPEGEVRRVQCVGPDAPATHSARAYSLRITPLPLTPAETLLAPHRGADDRHDQVPLRRMLTRTYE